MTTPLSLKELANKKFSFVTPNQQNKALVDATGKTLYELIAEAVEFERQNMLAGQPSQNYMKLLTSLLGKFAHGAPSEIKTENSIGNMSREELEAYRDNLMTRVALSNLPEEKNDATE